MKDRKLAEVFPPGEFIQDELDIRGWTQEDLATVLGRTIKTVNEIMQGKRGISPETAKLLGDAFGTSPQYWMNLDAAYRLHRTADTDPLVGKRAKLFAKAPINEMLKRNWIEPSDNVEVLEQRLLSFYEIEDLDEQPKVFAHSPRKSTAYDMVSTAQLAWLYRGKHLANCVTADHFTFTKLDNAVDRLRALLENPIEIRHVPRVLSDAGIRLLLVRNLPSTRIDGASFWIGTDSPVIMLSMRYDRIDWFWHTLMHEVGHIRNKDESSFDVEIYSENLPYEEERPEEEARADAFAANALVPTEQLDNFIIRVRPLYNKRRIEGFAKRIRVHPGIVVGQLHYKGEIKYSQHRGLLTKVRDVIEDAALADGWGTTLPASA